MTVTAEVLSVPAPPSDRRGSARFKLVEPLTTFIGRGTGTLIDLSATGARIRHTCAVVRGAEVRVKFEWNAQRFEAVGQVLASRVSGIGPDGTLFESRIHFLRFTHDSSTVLERALADFGEGNLRKWVANLRGWTELESAALADETQTQPVRTFVLCRYVNKRWEQRVTHQPAPPADGFTVAIGTEPSEIRALCRTYEGSDVEGRRLLQLLTGAVLRG
jgi:hypothetical protein